MRDAPFVPVIYLHKLIEVMEEENIPVEHLKKEWGIDMKMAGTPGAYVSYDQVEAVVSSYLHLTNRQNPGVNYGLRLELLTHGLLAYVYSYKGGYYDLIKHIVTYMNVRLPLLELSIHQKSHYFSVQIHAHKLDGSIKAFILQTFITSLYKLGSLLIPDIHIYTEGRLFKHNLQLETSFPTLIQPDSPCNELRYYTKRCAIPLPQLSLRHKKATSPSLPDFVLRLRQHLLHHCDTPLSTRQAASYLNMSERTLRRQLANYGYSYRSMRQEVCMNTALRYLQSTRLSIERIASKCGYSSQASFTSAFQKYMDCTPGAARRKARHDNTLKD